MSPTKLWLEVLKIFGFWKDVFWHCGNGGGSFEWDWMCFRSCPFKANFECIMISLPSFMPGIREAGVVARTFYCSWCEMSFSEEGNSLLLCLYLRFPASSSMTISRPLEQSLPAALRFSSTFLFSKYLKPISIKNPTDGEGNLHFRDDVRKCRLR